MDERIQILKAVAEPFQGMSEQEVLEKLKQQSMSGGKWRYGYNIAYWNNNVEVWGKAKVYKFSHKEIVKTAQ